MRNLIAVRQALVALWTQAGKLLLKVSYLLFKVRILRSQNQFLLQHAPIFSVSPAISPSKVNYVLAKPGGGRDANGVFGNGFGTHGKPLNQTETALPSRSVPPSPKHDPFTPASIAASHPRFE